MQSNEGSNFQEYRERWLSTHQNIINQQVELAKVMHDKSYSAIIEYSKLAINLSFILNGAAAVAVVYNAQNIGDAWKDIVPWCSAGAVCAVICAGFSYFAQRSYYANDVKNSRDYIRMLIDVQFKAIHGQGETPIQYDYTPPKLANILSWVACSAIFTSIICFSWALYKTINAL